MKQNFIFLLCIFSIVLTASIAGKPAASALGSVAQYFESDSSQLVIVNIGRSHGLQQDWVLNSYRYKKTQNGVLTPRILTGKVKIKALRDSSAVAEVIGGGGALSQAVFSDYPNIMVGDKLHFPDVKILNSAIISPLKILYYNEIFIDPGSNPETYELKDDAKDKLSSIAKTYLGFKDEVLMVEAYTDTTGPSVENQHESYQRALIIRQFLINELSFEEQKIGALGLGEIKPIEDSGVPGSEKLNRRIEFRLVPQ